jgi:hypothetical protein
VTDPTMSHPHIRPSTPAASRIRVGISRRAFIAVGLAGLAAGLGQACAAVPRPAVAPRGGAAGASADPAAAPSLAAAVYASLKDPNAPQAIRPDDAGLANLVPDGGRPLRLRGRLVEVVNRGVLVARDARSGGLKGMPMGSATANSVAGFRFKPRNGGPLPWENEEAEGRENDRLLEAARFGEVNAYFHADRALAYANGLLAELGAGPLPVLRIVVGAHFGSRLPGYGADDGDLRDGSYRPFSGGHYRRPSTVFEDHGFAHDARSVHRHGEVHLGPGRAYILDGGGRPILVDGQPYASNPSHNPGIVIHEAAHHIISHTADFRANAARLPDAASNRKIHMDEGTADYWAATLLGTPDIYQWHRASEAVEAATNRDLSGPRTTADFIQGGNPHLNGNIWASALWDLRVALGLPRATDLLVMKMLLLAGGVGPSNPTQDEEIRRETMALKDDFRDGLVLLLAADEALNGRANWRTILDVFARRGIDEHTPDAKLGRPASGKKAEGGRR